MDIDIKQKLIQYLGTFITKNKRQKIAAVAAQRTRYVTTIVEDIFQSHNASAVLRSCEIFGIQDVHVVEKQYAFRAKKSVAMGASDWIDIEHYKDTITCLEHLKKAGYTIVATTPQPTAYYLPNLPIDHKLALVFGTEQKGLSDTAKSLADAFVTIPMYGFTESFNVSVSVGICLYDITHRLRQSTIAWQLSEEEQINLTLNWYRRLVRGSKTLEKEFLEKK
jgi:tRNA (guanosine-2'-O-)-methyltransferase